MEQALDTVQSPWWAEEGVWHRRETKVAGWTWIHQLSNLWSALPLQAVPLAVHTSTVQRVLLFWSFLSSMQLKIFQIPFRVPFKETILSETVFYISLQTCKGRLKTKCGARGVGFTWHLLGMTSFIADQIPSRRDEHRMVLTSHVGVQQNCIGWWWQRIRGFATQSITGSQLHSDLDIDPSTQCGHAVDSGAQPLLSAVVGVGTCLHVDFCKC